MWCGYVFNLRYAIGFGIVVAFELGQILIYELNKAKSQLRIRPKLFFVLCNGSYSREQKMISLKKSSHEMSPIRPKD